MKNTFTRKEQEYIEAMFNHSYVNVKNLPAGEASLFIENRGIQHGPDMNLEYDFSISKKFLEYHGISTNITYMDYMNHYLKVIQKIQKDKL
jgi:hypothetical protein